MYTLRLPWLPSPLHWLLAHKKSDAAAAALDLLKYLFRLLFLQVVGNNDTVMSSIVHLCMRGIIAALCLICHCPNTWKSFNHNVMVYTETARSYACSYVSVC